MNELQALWDISYLWAALLGGIGVSIMAGPLGAVMVWRRLAYFGDTLSHSGLLGITLALALHINVTLGILIIALLVAALLLMLQRRLAVSSDTLLGLLSHTTLALGLLVLAFMHQIQVDVLGFLYGDILAIAWKDVGMIFAGGFTALLVLYLLWTPLLRITVDPELAQAEGVPVQKVQVAYMLLLAVVVAIAIKVVGVLLITALLVVPAACARLYAKTPEKMAILASVIGTVAVLLGILISHLWDVPTGPAIVVTAAVFLGVSAIRLRN
jgi:zinc transport system permease protein